MDTDSLASSLSLAATFLGFAWLSLGANGFPNHGSNRPPYRFSVIVSLLRLAAVAAAVLSAHALLWSQVSPGVGVVALVTLGVLGVLVVLEQASRALWSKRPSAASMIVAPIRLVLPRGAGLQGRRPLAQAESPGQADQDGLGGPSAVFITEEEQANLDVRERTMIRSILKLDDASVREIMVPRLDIVAVEVDTSLAEAAIEMVTSGHSRLPVFRESIDDIVGVVHSRDLLPYLDRAAEYPPLTEVLRPAYFVPEAKRLDELLMELQEKHVTLAIVVDEYGGIEGLVALEDLLEEIVGEIEDEYSPILEPRVVTMANGDVMVDARVSLDNLSEMFSTHIATDDVDTVGGLVYSALGKMPVVGDAVIYNGLRIEVMSVLGRRIRKLKMSKTGT